MLVWIGLKWHNTEFGLWTVVCLRKEHVVLIKDGKTLNHPGVCQLLSEEFPS